MQVACVQPAAPATLPAPWLAWFDAAAAQLSALKSAVICLCYIYAAYFIAMCAMDPAFFGRAIIWVAKLGPRFVYHLFKGLMIQASADAGAILQPTCPAASAAALAVAAAPAEPEPPEEAVVPATTPIASICLTFLAFFAGRMRTVG